MAKFVIIELPGPVSLDAAILLLAVRLGWGPGATPAATDACGAKELHSAEVAGSVYTMEWWLEW
jgi:hypothetical protein